MNTRAAGPVLLMLLLAAPLLGQERGEDPVHVCQDYQVNETLGTLEASLADGDTAAFFDGLGRILKTVAEKGELCAPDGERGFAPVRLLLLSLLSRLPDERVRREVRNRSLALDRILAVGPGSDGLSAFAARGTLAGAAEAQAARHVEAGRYEEALAWYRIRGRLAPPPAEITRLGEAFCWAKCGAWHRVEEAVASLKTGPFARAAARLRLSRTPALTPPVFRVPSRDSAPPLPLPGPPDFSTALPFSDLAEERGPSAGGRSLPCTVGLAADRDRLYAAGLGFAAALDRATGRILWRYPEFSPAPRDADPARFQGQPVLWGDLLLVTAIDRILAFDRRTGKLEWTLGPGFVPGPAPTAGEPDFQKTAAFSNAVARGDTALVAWVADRGTRDLSLLTLSKGGRVLHRTFLCSAGSLERFGAPPAPRLLGTDRALFLQTDLGALFALEGASGHIRWVSLYARTDVRARDLLAPSGGLRSHAPVEAGPVVVFAPSDSAFSLAVHRITGEVAWRRPRVGQFPARAGTDRVLFAGREAVLVAADTGRVLAAGPLETRATGMPRATARLLLVPSASVLQVLDRPAGPATSRLPVTEGEAFDLYRLEGRLIALSSRRVVALEDGKRALARARALASQDDPARRLEGARGLAALGREQEAATLLTALARSAATAGPAAGEAGERLRPLLVQAFRRALDRGDGPSAGRAARALRDQARLDASFPPADAASAFLWLADDAFSRADLSTGLALCEETLRRYEGRTVVRPFARPVEEAVEELVAFAVRGTGLEGGHDRAARRARRRAGGAAELERNARLLAGTAAGAEAAVGSSTAVRQATLLSLYGCGAWGGASERAALRLARWTGSRGWPSQAAFWWSRFWDLAADRCRPVPWRQSPAQAPSPPAGPQLDNLASPPMDFFWHVGGLAQEDHPVPLVPAGAGSGRGREAFLGTRHTLWCVDGWTGQVRWIAPTGPRWGGAVRTGRRLAYVHVTGPRDTVSVEALDVTTGRVCWTRTTEHRLGATGEAVAFEALPGRIVVFLSLRRRGQAAVLCLEGATGALCWQVAVECRAPFATTAVHGTGILRLYGSRGRRYLLTAADGFCRSLDPVRGGESALPGESALVDGAHPGPVAGAWRAAGGPDSELWAEDRSAGRVLWKKSAPHLEALAKDRTGERVVSACRDDRQGLTVSCLGSGDGRLLWKRSFSRVHRVLDLTTHVRGLALVRMRRAMSEQVLALRLSDGRSAWQRTLAAASTLSLAGGLVAVASGSRDVLLLDPATGAVLQTLTHPRRVVEKAGFLPGHLLVLAHAGGVDFYGPRRAAPRPLGAAAQGRCARELGLERAAALLRRHRPREGVRWLGRALGDDETVRYDQWSAPLMNLEGLRRTAGWVDPAVCPAARLRTPPRINGLLDEYWPDWCRVELRAPERLGFVRGHRSPVQAWQGPHDLAADLYLAWDETNFYVTLEVFDRIRVQADGSKTHLNGDLVYLVIDPMGDGGTAFGYDDLVLVSASWKKGTSPFRGRKSSLKAKNFSSRSREDGAGLVLEDALPWTYINDQLTQRGLRAHHIRPRKGVSFGFNLAVVDDDGRGAEAYLTLAPGLSFGRDDRPGVWGRFGRHQLLVRCATPGTFARVVLK